jgi:hypothetical protein
VAQAAPATPAYKIGDTGPAGGLIFYDKGNSQGGWRYLEAAPAEMETTAILASQVPSMLYPKEKAVGMGKINTADSMDVMNNMGGGFDTAVRYCDDLETGGFDDWFLPSQDELNWMYGNLHRRSLGVFRNSRYWSSTTDGGNLSYCIDFTDGKVHSAYGYEARYRVRAVRQF